MIIKITIALICIVIDTLWESRNLEGVNLPQEDVQFIRDAVITHTNIYPNESNHKIILSVGDRRIERGYRGFVKSVYVLFDLDWFIVGDRIVLIDDGSIWEVESGPINNHYPWCYKIVPLNDTRSSGIQIGSRFFKQTLFINYSL